MGNILFYITFLFVSCSSLRFCESPSTSPLFRVIGGKPLDQSYFPWQAAVISYDDTGRGMLCGGTVIDEYWILSAAHCILPNIQKSYVLLGIESLSSPKYSIKVSRIVKHPLFDVESISNDIVLIKTTKSLLKPGVETVCIARNDKSLIKAGKSVTVTGFGLHIDNSTGHQFAISDVALETQVPIISLTTCSKEWRDMTLGAVTVTEKQICAGSLFHGTSPGDSGGPLISQDSLGRQVQVGITSFGASGLEGILDQASFPGVYTRVSSYIDWIDAVVTSASFSKSSSFVYLFIAFHLFLVKF